MSNARHASVLFGVSALLVLGGTTAMAGTVAQAQPAQAASTPTLDRSNAVLRADRAHADRLGRLAFAQQVLVQRRAVAVRSAALKRKAALARQAASARKAALARAAAKKHRVVHHSHSVRRAAAHRSSRSHVRSTAPFSGSARSIGRQMAAARGWTGDQWVCLNNLWTAESGWRTSAGGSSGPYGIPQANPGSKMSSHGSDWRDNPATQIAWGLNYIGGRYGSPCGAWRHFQSHGWY